MPTAEGKAQQLEVDKLIVAVGRVPNTAGLGAENVGLKMDDRGYIEVDSNCRTNLPTYMPWVTWCADPCWRIKPPKKASR